MDRYVLRSGEAARAVEYRLAYAEALNPAQLEAVSLLEGAALVVAGAGSGKTRTLVYRVARLVESGVDPTQILLLTFTRKAASEMLRRASRLLDGRCERVAGGTFHSFANTVLRRYGQTIGLQRSFSILDRGDCEDAINLLRARLGLDRKDKRFPRKQAIAEIFSMSVNKSIAVPQLIESAYLHLLDHVDALSELRDAYVAYKAEQQLLDYDDLLLKLRELLASQNEIRDRLGQQYRYLMVDEYQDTNRLQAEIVRLLASGHDNVMAVGDDAQSIYSFRGADFRNIMEFPALFPGARVITLEENYRSTQAVLTAANHVIARARERYTKHLFTRRGAGETPLLVAADSEQYQSRFVCQRILELREEGVELDEMAVLFRSSFHSFDLEIELSRHDIPFIKRGGFKFVETAHIKDVLAHLRVIANPRDAIAWHRILLLLEGIGPRTSEALVGRLRDALDPAAELETAAGRSGDLRALAGLLRRLPSITEPGGQLGEVLKYYDGILTRVYRDDYPKRQRDLEHFAAIAARYQSLETLLSDVALEPPTESVGDVLAADADPEGVLTLSTIHSAKGLEWRAVFVIWLVEGKFPSFYTLRDESELEEERRLLYVALTRAKDQLYLSYPLNVFDRASGMVLGRPSRFVDDLPQEVVKPVMLVEG